MSRVADTSIDYFEDEQDFELLKRRTMTGSVYTAVGQGFRVLITFATQILLSRLLLPEEFGIVAMAAPVIAFIELFTNLGFTQAVIQRERITQQDLTSLYWVGLAISVAAAAILATMAPLIGKIYGQPEVTLIVVVLACQLPLAALAGHASALMARKMRFGALAIVDVVAVLTTLVAVLLAASAGAGYWTIVIGQIAGTAMRAALDRILSGWAPSRPQWSGTALPLLRFGGQMSAFNFINYASSYADKVLIGALIGPRELGLFDRSFALVLRPVASIVAPISKVAIPVLSRMQGDATRYRSIFLAMFEAMLLLSTPVLVAMAVLAEDLVLLLLGPNWRGIIPMFSAISVAAMFTPFTHGGHWLFVSQDRAGEQVKVALVSSMFIILSMFAGLPWGALGVSIAYALAAPLVHGSYSWLAGRSGPVSRGAILKASYPVILGSIAAALALLGLKRLIVDISWLRCAIGLCLAYGMTLLVLAILPEGRRTFRLLLSLRQRLRVEPSSDGDTATVNA